MTDSDLPFALRPLGEYPPVRASVFEDPADEKSWHRSQRYESLRRFYEGRDPSWYASAVRPLQGARRVIDLGTGPGLALACLRDHGAEQVLGIDRWPGFARDADAGAPVILHDLSLPMPFLASSSVDGVLSHYVLDYASPITLRQVLRESHRILEPDGRLLIYLAAVGLGSGDDTRTVPYGPEAMRTLLKEAGFEKIAVDVTADGRNTIAQARRATDDGDTRVACGQPVRAVVDGETQLSAAFEVGKVVEQLSITVEGDNELVLQVPVNVASGRLSACIRIVSGAFQGTELQIWAWREADVAAMGTVRLEWTPALVSIAPAGTVEHVSTWSPSALALEPRGDAYRFASELRPGGELSEAERGAEGRIVAVETGYLVDSDVLELIGPGRNRFFVRRAIAQDGGVAARLDHQWLAGLLHGIVIGAQELMHPATLALCLWAGRRQALLYVEFLRWGDVDLVQPKLIDLDGPVLLVDPALGTSGKPEPVPTAISRLVGATPQTYLLLSGATYDVSSTVALDAIRGRVLFGGPASVDASACRDATEALRYLTERTLLMRLRREHRRPAAELGRRPGLGA